MINYNELLKDLTNGVGTVSVDDIRNEDKQKKNYGQRFPMLKKEKSTNVRLLALKSLAIPYDPFTGKETEQYNPGRKFRPEQSVTSIITALKMFYRENEEAKKVIMDKANVTEWDVTGDEVTNLDREIFAKVTLPRIYSINTVHINNVAVTGRDTGADYKMDVNRDAITGQLIKEWKDAEGNTVRMPQFIQNTIDLGDFLSSCYLEEYKKWEAKEGQGKTKQDKANEKMRIMGKSPLSQDRPKNFLLVMALPLAKGTVNLDLEELAKWELNDYIKSFRIMGYTQKIEKAVNDMGTLYKNQDVFTDFYEIDMTVGDEDDAQVRGQKAGFGFAVNSLNNIADAELKKKILGYIQEALDGLENTDKIVLGSSYINPLTSDVIQMLFSQVKQTVKLDDLIVGSGTMKRFAGIITDVWGDEAASLAVADAMGELPEENVSQEEMDKNRAEMAAAMNDIGEITIDTEE